MACWAEAMPAARGAWRWMEPYQQEAPPCGVVDKRLRPNRKEMSEEESEDLRGFLVLLWLLPHLVRSPRLMLLDRSSSLSYRRGLSKK